MVDDDEFGNDDAPPELHVDAVRARPRKTADAFRTISEVADELHVPQHVLRFWETKFPQVRPLKRGGGRRYYRPEDVFLLRRVADLLYTQGYTIKGVQRLLREGGGALEDDIPPASLEERMAAEAERSIVSPVDALPPKRMAPPLPQLQMPGLLPDPEYTEPARLPSRSTSRPKAEPQETERLRLLLTDTLHVLEELRRLIG